MPAAVSPLPPVEPAPPRRPVRRVLMTADTVGGIWTYAIGLCRGLGEAGVETVLATMGAPASPAQRAQARAVPRLTLEESAFKLEWMEGAAEDVTRAGGWLLELEQRHRPDVIHLNGYAHAALPWHAPALVVAHSCVHTWWRAVRGGEPPRSFDQYTRALRQGAAAAARLVAPTKAHLRPFQAAHGVLAPAEVISNGCDGGEFLPAAKQEFFLCVGRLWDEAKGARQLAAIAPELPWPVRLAGDATSPDGCTLQLPNLELLGRRDPAEVAALMAHAPIYVLPARYEPFGLSVLEAALSGCALVLGDIPTLREVWGDAAEYVPPDQPAALRQTLGRLAASAPERAALASRARRRARIYTAAAMTDRYLALYAELLAPSANAAPRPAALFA